MTETTEFYKAQKGFDDKDLGYHTWSAENVERDLIFQGGLNISYLRVNNEEFHGYLEVHNGSHNGNRFSMRWENQNFLLVRLENEDPELIEAFSKVLEQRPFARYVFEGEKEITFEWDNVNSEKRYERLKEDKKRLELRRLD